MATIKCRNQDCDKELKDHGKGYVTNPETGERCILNTYGGYVCDHKCDQAAVDSMHRSQDAWSEGTY
ncbi:MAG: hypothetical protein KAJ03_04135 [Gammaproteobacteria bacterium]|nr:hypothetical protein [Gammaproteobacteria bacterium]